MSSPKRRGPGAGGAAAATNKLVSDTDDAAEMHGAAALEHCSPAALRTMSFDSMVGEDSIAVPDQPAIAVYQNDDYIVLRQRDIWEHDEHHFIVVEPEKALILVKAILREAGFELDVATFEPGTKSRPKDRTAAERQRRYRERQRNGRDERDSNAVTRDGDALLPSIENDADGGSPETAMPDHNGTG